MTYDRKRGAGLVAGPANGWFNTKFTSIIASWVHTYFRAALFILPRATLVKTEGALDN
jgi:hypothetical protein